MKARLMAPPEGSSFFVFSPIPPGLMVVGQLESELRRTQL
jgi:hypothetical protein